MARHARPDPFAPPLVRAARRVNAARAVLLAAIRFYKRRVSPRKGFACAYRVHVGACSCSTLGLRAVSRYGAWRGLGVLRARLGQCRLAAIDLRAARSLAMHGQRGFIDCACDLPCDASCADGACEALACLDLGSDCKDACNIGDCGGSGGSGSDPEPRAPIQRRRRRGEPVSDGTMPEPPAD